MDAFNVQAGGSATFNEGERIEVAWKLVDTETVGKLSYALRTNPTIKCVDLCDNRLGGSNTATLSEALAVARVQHVIVRFNSIGKLGCDSLSNVLDSTKLQILDLRGNKLTASDVTKLMSSVAHHSFLRVLGLGGNELGPEGVSTVCNALIKNCSVEQLELWNNNMGTTGADHVARLLSASITVLRRIDI